MGLNIDVYMGYNIKGIKERGASKLSTDHSVEEVIPPEGNWGTVVRSAQVQC